MNQATKFQRVSRSVVSHPRKTTDIFTASCVDLRGGLTGCGQNRPQMDSIIGLLNCSESLYRLSYPSSSSVDTLVYWVCECFKIIRNSKEQEKLFIYLRNFVQIITRHKSVAVCYSPHHSNNNSCCSFHTLGINKCVRCE